MPDTLAIPAGHGVELPMSRAPGIGRGRPDRAVAVVVALGLLLGGCANPQVQTYRNDPHAYLKELVHCENNYAALKDTPQCKAAIELNEQMFPGWYP
ncbi:MAG TPA: hypothetical protein VMF62_02210 [Acetobacteraceae bacterium]|nr:hypothetical protein [Acetobacteraceae bacterium]